MKTSCSCVFACCAETKDFETIASVCGLTRLLDLDLDSSGLHLEPVSSGTSRPETAAAAPPQHSEALELARSAAALQRLVVRLVPVRCCRSIPNAQPLLCRPTASAHLQLCLGQEGKWPTKRCTHALRTQCSMALESDASICVLQAGRDRE